ncbi:MAG: hypothetical protein U0457_11675 [Candidatus Sericytochromatia bacterium]
MNILKLRDETATGKINYEFELIIDAEIITVKELITKRVTYEVEKYNSQKEEFFNGLVQPTESEKSLNGYKMRHKKEINLNKQIEKALESFESNGFFIIANNRQLENLDEAIFLDKESNISFIKLVHLVGG